MKTILVVEDGTEYSEILAALGPGNGEIQLLRAGNAEQSLSLLRRHRIDAVLLDVVFDRTPREDLVGDLGPLIARFAGNSRRAERHLAENQGFYLLELLAPLFSPEIAVVVAYDFRAEPGRLASLRKRVPALEGLADGTPSSALMDRLLGR